MGDFMATIAAIGRGIPEHTLKQSSVKQLIPKLFDFPQAEIDKLLPVFDHAAVSERQIVVPPAWFMGEYSFAEANEQYLKKALQYSLQATDECLMNTSYLSKAVPYDAIDAIIYVSSTGIATPTIDARMMNERGFRDDVVRMPLWGLGCAGGASALSRAYDWLQAYPDKLVLIVCCELCSLTFQKQDQQMSNFIGTAIFGDGAAAALMIGDQSSVQSFLLKGKPQVMATNSFTQKHSLDAMGWELTNDGLEVIFSKEIPNLVNSLWKKHVQTFLKSMNMHLGMLDRFLVHPGGKKILTTMEDSLQLTKDQLIYAYDVLKWHGNMSSATILYVINNWLLQEENKLGYHLLAALGPGFSSELLMLRWDES